MNTSIDMSHTGQHYDTSLRVGGPPNTVSLAEHARRRLRRSHEDARSLGKLAPPAASRGEPEGRMALTGEALTRYRVRRLTQAMRDANNGMSLVQSADLSLERTEGLLDQMASLTRLAGGPLEEVLDGVLRAELSRVRGAMELLGEVAGYEQRRLMETGDIANRLPFAEGGPHGVREPRVVRVARRTLEAGVALAERARAAEVDAARAGGMTLPSEGPPPRWKEPAFETAEPESGRPDGATVLAFPRMREEDRVDDALEQVRAARRTIGALQARLEETLGRVTTEVRRVSHIRNVAFGVEEAASVAESVAQAITRIGEDGARLIGAQANTSTVTALNLLD